MKAATVKKVTVNCDSCDFTVEDDIENWHGKSCPVCGEKDIINDSDIETYNAMMNLVGAVNEAIGDVPASPGAEISISVRTTRKK